MYANLGIGQGIGILYTRTGWGKNTTRPVPQEGVVTNFAKTDLFKSLGFLP